MASCPSCPCCMSHICVRLSPLVVCVPHDVLLLLWPLVVVPGLFLIAGCRYSACCVSHCRIATFICTTGSESPVACHCVGAATGCRFDVDIVFIPMCNYMQQRLTCGRMLFCTALQWTHCVRNSNQCISRPAISLTHHQMTSCPMIMRQKKSILANFMFRIIPGHDAGSTHGEMSQHSRDCSPVT